MPGVCGSVSLALVVLYVAYMATLIHEMCSPQACKGNGNGNGCYQALLAEQRVDLRMLVAGKEVWQALNVSADEQLDFKVALPVPPEVRHGSVDHLTVEMFLAVHGGTNPIAVASTNAVKRMLPRVQEASMLLSEISTAHTSDKLPIKDVGPAAADYDGKVPHYIYARSRLDVRLVRDWTPHASVYFQDGVLVGSSFDHQQRRYAPHWYADSFPLLAKHAVPLSSDESRAPAGPEEPSSCRHSLPRTLPHALPHSVPHSLPPQPPGTWLAGSWLHRALGTRRCAASGSIGRLRRACEPESPAEAADPARRHTPRRAPHAARARDSDLVGLAPVRHADGSGPRAPAGGQRRSHRLR